MQKKIQSYTQNEATSKMANMKFFKGADKPWEQMGKPKTYQVYHLLK